MSPTRAVTYSKDFGKGGTSFFWEMEPQVRNLCKQLNCFINKWQKIIEKLTFKSPETIHFQQD